MGFTADLTGPYLLKVTPAFLTVLLTVSAGLEVRQTVTTEARLCPK